MGNLIVQLQTQIRQLSGELLTGDAPHFRDMVPELNQIAKTLQESRSALDVETCLWHLWVILEEVQEHQCHLHPSVKPTAMQRLVRIQAYAFRLSQRHSFAGKHKVELRSRSAFQKLPRVPVPILAEKRPARSRKSGGQNPNAWRG